MHILSFHIENFRNLRLAECSELPDFIVICGGNGCGKSALLEALITAKEIAGSYGYFSIDPSVISASATKTIISIKLAFTKNEQLFIKETFSIECPETQEFIVEISKDGGVRNLKISSSIVRLLRYYSSKSSLLGFFDYIPAYRRRTKSQPQIWDPELLSDDKTKETLTSETKFQLTKQYLISLVMRDIQEFQREKKSSKSRKAVLKDSLKEIRAFFDSFFAPMKFKDVLIFEPPFKFIISTPLGDIDIDDLSSGEKEVLNIFIRFHQLKPNGAIILFDEADAHLHPDLERRYLKVLRNLNKGNQMFLTTHSPEMMIAAGTDSLYTILKEPLKNGGNQFIQVTQNEHLYSILSDLMGSRGIVSFNKRIIFIEGENASADREIYEAAYPPGKYNVSFVPAGNSSMVRKTAEQVNELLTSSIDFQEYYSIVDGDIERFESDPTGGKRLFKLPIYHIENLLLDENEIFKVTRSILRQKCPYKNKEEVTKDLQKLLLEESHLRSYTKALFSAKIAKIVRDITKAIYKQKSVPEIPKIEYSEAEKEAKKSLTDAIKKGTWHARCKGKELLKAYCGKHNFKYEYFRNLLISRIKTPPKPLAEIMNKILKS